MYYLTAKVNGTEQFWSATEKIWTTREKATCFQYRHDLEICYYKTGLEKSGYEIRVAFFFFGLGEPATYSNVEYD